MAEEVLWREDVTDGAVLRPSGKGLNSKTLVRIEGGYDDWALALYPGEARSLAAALVAWADKAEPATPRGEVETLVVKVPRGATLGGEVRVEQGPWGVNLGLSVGGSAWSFLNLPPADVRSIGAFLLGAPQPVEPEAKPAHRECAECGHGWGWHESLTVTDNRRRARCTWAKGPCHCPCYVDPDNDNEPAEPIKPREAPHFTVSVKSPTSVREILEQLTREQAKVETLTRERDEARAESAAFLASNESFRRSLEESKRRDEARSASAPIHISVTAATFESYVRRLGALEIANKLSCSIRDSAEAHARGLAARVDRLEGYHQGVLSSLRDLEADVEKIRQGLRAGGA